MNTDLINELNYLSAEDAAYRLIGCEIVRVVNGVNLVGRIVETEAYDQSDASSHSYRGVTKRNSAMFGPAGHLYVYFTYGMHYCMNIVIGSEDNGSAVLIRAIEPLKGIDKMQINRGTDNIKQLTNGPAKLTQALNINLSFNGHDLRKQPLTLIMNQPVGKELVRWTPRIGIREDMDKVKLWRVALMGNPYISRRE